MTPENMTGYTGYIVDKFTLGEFQRLKLWVDDIYSQWLEIQGKEEPDVLENLTEPGAIYLRQRLRPNIVAGDDDTVWTFSNLDYATAWCFVLSRIKAKDESGEVRRIEWETWFAYDSEIESLGWNRPVQVIFPPLLNGETKKPKDEV